MSSDESSDQRRPIQDERAEFILAVSMCAELEALCGASGALRAMAFVGLARCEITQYGVRFCDQLQAVEFLSVVEGLDNLHEIVTELLRGADDLAHAIRLHEARQFVEDARSVAV